MPKEVIPKIPFDIEAEKLLLADILGFPDDTTEYVRKLNPLYFYYKPHEILFEVCQKIYNIGSVPEYVTVIDALNKLPSRPQELSDEYLSEIFTLAYSLSGIEDHYRIVKEKYILRNLIQTGQKVIKIGNTSTDAEQALAEVVQEIATLTEETESGEMVGAKEVFQETINEIMDNQNGKYKKGLNTGFKQLDWTIKGLTKGELILLAARPSVGKTAFALNIIANIARANNDKVMAMFSLEMSAPLLMKRMISYATKIPLSPLGKEGGVKPSEIAAVMGYKSVLIGKNSKNKNFDKIYFDDNAVVTPLDIQSKCQRLKREVGLDLIVIDYLQLMNSDKNAKSKNEEVSEITRKLKILARKLEVPILLLSQVSRASDARGIKDHSHRLSDLRDSGAIEQDADVVMFLYKPSQYEETEPENKVILQVKKNRNGQQRDINLVWEGAITAFWEAVDENSYNVENAKQTESAVVAVKNEDFDFEEKNIKDDKSGELDY